jgi:hypothetical protein
MTNKEMFKVNIGNISIRPTKCVRARVAQ